MVMLKLICCWVGSMTLIEGGSKPALIADMDRDNTAFYKRFREGDSDRNKANAIIDLCQLHNQIWSDPRYSLIEKLRGMRNKVVFELKTAQKVLRKKNGATNGIPVGSTSDGTASQQAAFATTSQNNRDAWLDPLLIGLQYTPGPNQIAVHAGSFGGGDNGPELVSLIEATIHPEHWDINGGPGHIHYYRPVMVLIVRAGSVQHEDMSNLLEGLRESGR